MWEQIGITLALVLVVEGVMPFLNPKRFRETLQVMSTMEDKTLRIIGFSSMISGIVLLYLI